MSHDFTLAEVDVILRAEFEREFPELNIEQRRQLLYRALCSRVVLDEIAEQIDGYLQQEAQR